MRPGLHAALPILEIFETLQSSSVNYDGMINSVRLVKSEVLSKLVKIFAQQKNLLTFSSKQKK